MNGAGTGQTGDIRILIFCRLSFLRELCFRMTLPIIAVVLGLALLVWSADRFVEGSASTARHFGMPPLLIGMVIVGFGTSAPEMVVSALAAFQGNPGSHWATRMAQT